MSQARLAKAIGASQSQIARIESGDENITASTVERITNALDGHFEVRITPSEMAVRPLRVWWDASHTLPWSVEMVEGRQTTTKLQVRITIGADIPGNTLTTGDGPYIEAKAN